MSTPLPELISELRRLMAELPPAPWETIPDAYNGKEELWGYFHGIKGVEVDFSGKEVGKEAAFIVAMRNAMPILLDELERRSSHE